MNIAGLGVEELAALVCTTLEHRGIDVVLTGGSCVSIWTHNAYASLDLDFIALGLHSNRQIGEALRDIDFSARQANGRYFRHPDTDLVLEFPPGPLMVGDEQVREERIDKRTSGSVFPTLSQRIPGGMEFGLGVCIALCPAGSPRQARGKSCG